MSQGSYPTRVLLRLAGAVLVWNALFFPAATMGHPADRQLLLAAMVIGLVTAAGSIGLTFVPLAQLRLVASIGRYFFAMLFGLAVFAAWLAPNFGFTMQSLANASLALGLTGITMRIVWLMERSTAN